MFEMMVGYPPFYNEEQHITFQNIINWWEHFVIPEEANLSKEACDFLKRLITDSEIRLGRNGAEEVKDHPFFKGVDWNNIRN
jgi:protein-serine/threonine kinase